MIQELFGLLLGARVEDTNGEEMTDIVEIRYKAGKLTVVVEAAEDEEDDPDDGERETFEDQPMNVRAIAGGKR